MPRRAIPTNETVDAYADEFLVVCPRCSGQAVVRDRGPDVTPRIRLTCASCAHTQELERRPSVHATSSDPRFAPGALLVGAAVDAYFRLPLWLQVPCCGATLWAYNARHLAALVEYVGAELRERRQDEGGWRNAGMRSRLPRWMQVAKNREEVLRCAERLPAKLGTGG